MEVVDWRDNRDTLLSIRFEVFVDEQNVPAVLEEDGQDPPALHLLASIPGTGPVATARLLPNGHIGRMAVRHPFRGQGVGSALLKRLIEQARMAGMQQVFLNAQCSAEAFYERFGFTALGDPFDDAGIPHRRMQLHLDACT